MIGKYALSFGVVLGALAFLGSAAADGVPSYEKDIAPLLKASCHRCHGPKQQKAELNLSTLADLRAGGESGDVIVPGKPEESLLFELVHDGEMPPGKKNRLSPENVELIRRWISNGARLGSEEFVETRSVTQHDVIPRLLLRCTVCHGTRRREADLDLRTRASMLKGGKSGPAIVPGKPEESLVLKRIHAGEMPPKRELVSVSIKVIPPDEVELLTEWIAAGAPELATAPDVATSEPDPFVSDEDRKFWAFQKPTRPPVPKVEHDSRVSNPVDGFVLHRLEERGLTLSPQADRLTLVRRVYFDLTGLPPTPKQVEEFLADKDPGAYERLVDQLLDSPRYGERWGRYWLDAVGYSDSEGIQHSDMIRPHAYRYRDYVIRAFNDDKPYDRFVREQVAGDELADYESAPVITPELYDNLVATGFLRMTVDGSYAMITNFVPDRLAQISDEIEVVSGVLLGLTMKCARCHSHKFDPIPQRDYYRLAATLKGAYDEHDWLVPAKRVLRNVTTEERQSWEARNAEFEKELAGEEAKLEEQRRQFAAPHLEERLAKLPEVLRDDLRKTFETFPERRDEVEKYLAEKFKARLGIDVKELKKLEEGFAKAAEPIEKKISELQKERPPEPGVRALWDRGEPSPTYVLVRGNYLTPGRLVGPGVPSVLTDGRTPFAVEAPWPHTKKTGRRLAFARWLTSPDNPLTARVMVNRIWKHHFGRGIVRTLDNFGRAGAPPTHPELLDWLATEFMDRGWSVKTLHRILMTSSTYRQSSIVQPEHEKLDPDNSLLSRMELRRLEAESLRDTLLAVSGELDLTPYGPADPVTKRDDGLVTSVRSEKGWRRSIYILQRRSQRLTLLENYDLPPMNPNCIERAESVVAPQALHLLNNGMIHELSVAFARRVLREVGDGREAQIEHVYRLGLQRAAEPTEVEEAKEFLAAVTEKWARLAAEEKVAAGETESGASGGAESVKDSERSDDLAPAERALANFCHAIINLAYFLYVD